MSRKYHQAGLLTLNKCLIGDIFRFLQISVCYQMNNTIRCFGRIDHTPVIITLMCFGLSYNSAHTFFQVMQKSLHRIKTDYGISSPVCGDKSVPLAGYR